MQDLEAISRHVEITALSIQERVARIHDALYHLHDLTLAIYEATPRDDAAVRQWIDASGFGIDEHGYFERLDLLAQARAGEVALDQQTYYANATIAQDPEALFRMYALRGLAKALSTLTSRLPGLAWLYYQDATKMVVAHPMHDPCTVVPPDFDWHNYHTYLSATENNPKRKIRWTPPNIDYGGKGLMVAPSIPLYRDDELFGVWSFDVPVSTLVRDRLSDPVVEEQQLFIVDREGVLIAHDSLDALVAPKEGDVYRKPLAELGGGFASLDLASLWETRQASLTDADGALHYVVAQPIASLDWLLLASFPARGLLEVMERSFLEAFERAKGGDLSHRVEATGSTDMSGLVKGFNEMAAALQSTLIEKEQALRELATSRDRARGLLEASPIGLGIVTDAGRLVDANPELMRLIGRGFEALGDLHFFELVPANLRASVTELATQALSRGAAGPLETELVREDQEMVPVRLLARRVEQKEQLLVVLGVEDLGETRHLQAQLLHTQKMQAMGKLAGGIAHDFNNLLTVIMSNAQLLSFALTEDAPGNKHLDGINLAAERAAALTAQLLTFSRQGVIQPCRIDLQTIVSESEALLNRILDDDVTLDVVIEGTPPAVRADAAQLLQVVMNLVLNARDALRDTGSCIEVRLSAVTAEDGRACACIAVRDDGPGIDVEVQRHVFEPFFTTKAHGTGLGLSTVHDIVTSCDGSIDLVSAPGRGATFRILLPAWTEDDEVAEEKAYQLDGPIVGCVVLVDDEPLVRDASVSALQRAEIDVKAAAGADDALRLIEELGDGVALLLTDVVMPSTGGRDLATKAREIYPQLPVLYMSGYTDDTILHHGVQTSTVELLRKPFSPQLLVHAVKRAIARAAAAG